MLFIILRFALIGPFIGGGVFLITSHIMKTMLTFSSLSEIMLALISVLPAMVLSSFVSLPIGLFPAFATGAIYCYILNKHTKRNLNKMLRLSIGGAIGLLVGATFGLLFSSGDVSSIHKAANFIPMAFAGTFGGGLSALSVGDATYDIAYKKG